MDVDEPVLSVDVIANHRLTRTLSTNLLMQHAIQKLNFLISDERACGTSLIRAKGIRVGFSLRAV
jgi:hypothetical protein